MTRHNRGGESATDATAVSTKKRGATRRGAAALALATCLAFPATVSLAEEGGPWWLIGVGDASIASSLPPSLASAGGLRPALAAYGITFELNYLGEYFGNTQGGERKGSTYDGVFEAAVEIDLEKFIGWRGGTFFANGFQIHGKGLSTFWLGNLMPVSNAEAQPATRLFEIWFEQALFDDTVAVRVGQLSADSEFFISEYAGLFLNGTFGWAAGLAEDLPSGGPAYPLATPGVQVKFTPSDSTTILVAMFNGDPSGPPAPDSDVDDPQLLNRNGLEFRLEDPALLMAEGQLKYNAVGLPGTIKFGGWTHLGTFDDLRFDSTGVSLADEDNSTGIPHTYTYNRGIYAVLDQQLVPIPGEDETKGIGMFARFATSPSNRNLIDYYFDAGLTFAGLIPYRPNDAFGVAFGFAHISRYQSGLDQDTIAFTGEPMPIQDYEAALEITYQAEIVPGWTIQPDFQYIFHPGGNVPDPNDPTQAVKDAVVFGVRTVITY